MKTLHPQRFYTFYFFLGWFCLFAQFVWADGGRCNPYISQVEVTQIDRGNSNQSTVIKLKLESSLKNIVDSFDHIEISDSSGGVYRFSSEDFYSVDSGDFYLMELPFFLDSEINVTIRDRKGNEYAFATQPSSNETLQSSSYDGIWSGTTNQNYEVRFLVSDNIITRFQIKRKFRGSGCVVTSTTNTSGSYPISGNSFIIQSSWSGTNPYEDTKTGTFVSNAKCDGTWDATYSSLFDCTNASGSGTWTANKYKPPTAPPDPTLKVTTSGTIVTVSWDAVPIANGYILNYAPYPYTGPDSIGSINMGTQTGGSFDLWRGAGFYLAVQAYNDVGNSGYSNIEYFIIGSSISVIPTTLSIMAGETGICTINNGTNSHSASSSNTSVATVSVSGSTLSVTGVSAGSATITVSDNANDLATVSVKVSEIAGEWTFTYSFSSSSSYTCHYDIRADGSIYDLDYSFYSPTIGNQGYTVFGGNYEYYVYGGLGFIIDRHFFFNYTSQTDKLEGIYIQTDCGGNPYDPSGGPYPMTGDRY